MLNNDFVYVDDYKMQTAETWLENFETELIAIPNGFFNNQRETLLDRQDITSFSFVRKIEGVDHRVTNVGLLKDSKFWRQKVNLVTP